MMTEIDVKAEIVNHVAQLQRLGQQMHNLDEAKQVVANEIFKVRGILDFLERLNGKGDAQ